MLLFQDDSNKNFSVIGLLDIYGFEVFQNNRYSCDNALISLSSSRLRLNTCISTINSLILEGNIFKQ